MSGPDVFLSYNRKDTVTARQFAEGLEGEGLSVWWDQALRSGEAYDEVTEDALKNARAVVVLWSPNSVASRWVRVEATVADRHKTLIPAMIAPCERPIMFELTQTAELAHWGGERDDPEWQAFVSDIRKMVDNGRSGETPDFIETEQSSTPASEVRSGQRGDVPSLAILPFTNRSRIEDDEIFAEGMVDDIVAALTQGANVKVLAGIATAHLKGAALTDLAKVGEQLGVRYLLEGNVKRSGSHFQVTTQLIEAASGHVRWSGRFGRPLDELAELQEELATEVALNLDTKVSAIEMERALAKPGDLTAWEAITRSQAAMRHIDAHSLAKSIEEARRAVSIAPDYAFAHATLAGALGIEYMFDATKGERAVSEIRSTIERALELDAGTAITLLQVAQAFCSIEAPDEGYPWAKRAAELAPNNGYAHYIVGMACSMMNRLEEAIERCEIAATLLPGHFTALYVKAWHANALIRKGEWQEAEIQYDRCLEIGPDFAIGQYHKAMFCWRDGRREQAVGIVNRLRAVGLDFPTIERVFRIVFLNSPTYDEVMTAIEEVWEASG